MERSGESFYLKADPFRGSLTKSQWTRQSSLTKPAAAGLYAHEYDKYVNSERRCTKCSSQKIMPQERSEEKWFPAEPRETNLIRRNYAGRRACPSSPSNSFSTRSTNKREKDARSAFPFSFFFAVSLPLARQNVGNRLDMPESRWSLVPPGINVRLVFPFYQKTAQSVGRDVEQPEKSYPGVRT